MTPRHLITAACLVVSATLAAHPFTEPVGTIVLTVSSATGDPVAGLTSDDLSVAVDGHGEDIISLTAAPTSLATVVLLDQSRSMTDIVTPETDSTIAALALALRPEDHVQIGNIAGTTTISTRATPARRDLESALKNLPKPKPFSASPLWDAVDAGVRALSTDPGRRLLLLVTDGRANASRLNIEEAARSAALQHVAVSTIDRGLQQVMRQDNSTGIAVQASPSLQWISRTTGGLYYVDPPVAFRQSSGKINDAVAHAIRDQRSPYVLTIALPDDGKFHDIRVRSLDASRVVHAPTVVRADVK